LTNACFVASIGARTVRDWRNPAALLGAALARDALLRDRFAHATLVAPPVVLGPLAVDVVAVPHIDGLLLAGDASGFIDPMTGDGLRFAFRGGELAARAALRVLDHGWDGIHEALASERAAAFAPKWRFNRALRALVSSPRAVAAAGMAARLAPAALRAIVAHAGDCNVPA
jgi:flavin-dependent dehydrogenase